MRWIDKVLEIALERAPTAIVETAAVAAVSPAVAADGQGEVVKH